MNEQPEMPIKTELKRNPNGTFLPGNHESPGRPPKETTFSDIARTLLAAKEIHIEYTYPKKGVMTKATMHIESDKSINHSLVATLVKEGMDGNVNAIKELINRTDGLPRQPIDIGGQPDNPVLTSEVDAQLAVLLSQIVKTEQDNADPELPPELKSELPLGA